MIQFMNSQFKEYVLTNYLNEYATINNAMNLKTSLSKDQKMINLGHPVQKIIDELFQKNIL